MKDVFIGLGQCGGRLLNVLRPFSNETIAINTNSVDIDEVSSECSESMLLAGEDHTTAGVGGDYKVGEQRFKNSRDEVGESLQKYIEPGDGVWISAALGGGTGAGGVIITAEIVHRLKPKYINMILVIAAEWDGVNRCYNSMVRLRRVYDRLCIDRNIVNVIILDNGKFESIQEANQALFQVIDEMFCDSEPMSNDSVGHADHSDLRTVFSTRCGCMVFGNRNGMSDSGFLGHHYDITPTAIWVQDISSGKHREQILEFSKANPETFFFHGEYDGETEQIRVAFAGLPLPATLIDNKSELISNVKQHNKRKDGTAKQRSARKMDLKGLKL